MGIRRFTAAALLVSATCCTLVAPAAQAATTTSCASAMQDRLTFRALRMAGTCAPSPDQGAPYVFHIGTLWAWRLVGLDVLLVSVGPATESCTAYQLQTDGSVLATGCSWVQ
ncbi:hypothetical protein [Amycolatopsis sp. CA-128772]|uniref:hypothetical protein n=1 Tax=Amycolatopsis sp. CA-128772 TaxID=2073159 RepID=UPI000CD1E255|nr:hypothetical protein [Amycolatopsis sp. CA-128772]